MLMSRPVSQPLTILGIETSCDETAAAVLRLGDAGPEVLSDVVLGTAHAALTRANDELEKRAVDLAGADLLIDE